MPVPVLSSASGTGHCLPRVCPEPAAVHQLSQAVVTAVPGRQQNQGHANSHL